MNSTEKRFLRRIKNKIRLDRIRNEVYRNELKVEKIELGQLRLVRVTRIGGERLGRKIYEAKEDGKRKRRKPRETYGRSEKCI